MGAAGRDFHNFNMAFRNNPDYEVIAFTATQIPFIEGRVYPPELAGPYYPGGIHIYPEEELKRLIKEHDVDEVVFAYSDVSHEYVMHKASLCVSLGANFVLLGPEMTMLKTELPVISVCAVRTGCGKSRITRKLAYLFKKKGIDVSVIRHPMPYRSFSPVIKFSTIKDIDTMACTIEEREEFEPLVEKGITVYVGVDYEKVLDEAKKTSRVIIWDGGNNDFSFIAPDLEIVLIDALRPGHETMYYPGEVNLRRADILIITKVNEAKDRDLESIKDVIKRENPDAQILDTRTILTLSDYDLIKGKNALVIEDGPTITHGGMPYGAGVSASRDMVSGFVDPRPYAIGSIKETYERYPHIGDVLPAMGYSEIQIKELEEVISLIPSDVVIMATPVDLRRIMKINKPVVRVFYDFDIDLTNLVEKFLREHAH